MKTVRLFVVATFIIGIFALSAFAQTAAQAKVAVIDTKQFFNLEGGIKKYATEYKKLELEFKQDQTSLQALATKITNLENELKAMQANKNVPIDPKNAQAKAAEYEKLNREFKFQKEDYDARVNQREAELVQPINFDIGKRITEFATQKGFVMVFDSDKLARDGSILYFLPSIDITKEFIDYYNALPAGSASK
ncbi:MAG: OmpH family outer membrane protein [Acidobacteriota bacterium]|nr:OmpH family outer membrane protein [Acidobacteriota bacterium]MDH3528894.1 OmpH family outer membrane protein [Acidobacteriota bacterium]